MLQKILSFLGLRPATPKPSPSRPSCPFYGFYRIEGTLFDCRSNGCGLADDRTPCAMEMAGEDPAWKRCIIFNRAENRMAIKRLLDQGCVFPDEMQPPGAKAWDGMRLRDWHDQILSK